MTEPHRDPATEGAARAAQIAALTVGVGEAMIRLRAQLAAERDDRDQATARAARATRDTDHAAARLRWQPAADRGWVATARTVELAEAWGAARPWAGLDPEAAVAMRRCEERLRQVHPAAMDRYDDLRSRGAQPERAMRVAAPLFATSRHSTRVALPPVAASTATPTRDPVAAAATARRSVRTAPAGGPPGRRSTHPSVATAQARGRR